MINKLVFHLLDYSNTAELLCSQIHICLKLHFGGGGEVFNRVNGVKYGLSS